MVYKSPWDTDDEIQWILRVLKLKFGKTLLYTLKNALLKTQEKLQVVCGVRSEAREVFVWRVINEWMNFIYLPEFLTRF